MDNRQIKQWDSQNFFFFFFNEHSNQMIQAENTFFQRENLPIMMDVDISSSHIERMVRSLHESAGWTMWYEF